MNQKANIEELRKLSAYELKNFKVWIGKQPSELLGYTLYNAIGRTIKERAVPQKGVVVVSECGEQGRINMIQKIERVYLDGKLIWGE